MYSERLLDHLRNPRYAGELPAPAITVQVWNPACGDVLQVSARLEAGRVVEARFKAQGCPPTIACGSALAEWLNQQEQLVVPGIALIEEAVGGLPPAGRHAAALAVDAVRELLRLAGRRPGGA